jgi:hypothetical protein
VAVALLLVVVAAALFWWTGERPNRGEAEVHGPDTGHKPEKIAKADGASARPAHPASPTGADPGARLPAKPATPEKDRPSPAPPDPRTTPPPPPRPEDDPTILTRRLKLRPAPASPAEFVPPRAAQEIRATLDEILNGPLTGAGRFERGGELLTRPGFPDYYGALRRPDASAERDGALRRLKAYRYLAGVPYRELTTSPERNHLAMAAATICELTNTLGPNPPNPGLSEEDYLYARKGTSDSILSWSPSPQPSRLLRHVDGWLADDSDLHVQYVDRRRWCLSPSLVNVGLGRAIRFAAMSKTDTTTIKVEDIPLIAYPAPGFVPVDFFRKTDPWSLALSTRDYKPPTIDRINVGLFPVEGNEADRAHPIGIRSLRVESRLFADYPCIIFEPAGVAIVAGQRYWLEVKGLETPDGAPTAVNYMVEFIVRN